MRRLSRSQGGFSLVELGVAMVIVGILGILVWRWVVSTRAPMQRPAMIAQMSEAQAALEGFVLVKHRLPCAAADETGNEACGNTTAIRFPWRTLGLSSRFGLLHYGVNRGGGHDLAVVPSTPSISPDLNISFTGMPVPPSDSAHSPPLEASTAAKAAVTRAQTAVATATARRAQANGLDWCHILRGYAADTTVAGVLTAGNATGSMPVAYVLVHPGENGQFDGNNAVGASATWVFDFPGRPQDDSFDDLALLVGPADLAERIGCVARLSEMQSAAQGAYAAYDSARVMQEYWSLRMFDITASESAVQSAKTGVAVAAMGLALATAGGVLSIASAANTEGVTAPVVILAAANVATAIAQTIYADKALKSAEEALEVSKDKLVATDAYAIQVYDTFTQALTRAIALDVKGLNP